MSYTQVSQDDSEDERSSSTDSLLIEMEKSSDNSSDQKKGDKEVITKFKHASVKKLLLLAKPEFPMLGIGMITMLIAGATYLAMPMYFGKMIDAVTVTQDKSVLVSSFVKLVITFVIGTVAHLFRTWLFQLSGYKLVTRVRHTLFKAILQREISFFDSNKTGELMSRISSDTQVLQSVLTSRIGDMVDNTAQLTGYITLLFITSWSLTLIMMACVPIVIIFAVFFGKKIEKIAEKFQEELAASAATAEEILTNVRTVRSFSQENRLSDKYLKDLEKTLVVGKKRAFIDGCFQGGVSLFAQVSIAFVLYVGATQVLAGEISVGVLTTFTLYTVSVAFSVGILSSFGGEIMGSVGSAERIFELLAHVHPEEGDKKFQITGEIKLKDVHFIYPSRPDVEVLKGVSITLEPGKVVAVVGHSGGGKSTIVSLIERFYEPTSGEILLDDVPIKQLSPHWYRSNIGVVSQEPILFGGSIRENISFGIPNATNAQIEEAAIKANAHQFIDALPEKYGTLVGEKGVKLSGGQRQRIAIARALLLNPKILLLDEATSALDAESEFLVQQAIDRLMENRTVLVIAHRLSTVRTANLVVVLDGGVVAETGTHEQLIQSNTGIYQKLVKRQLQMT